MIIVKEGKGVIDSWLTLIDGHACNIEYACVNLHSVVEYIEKVACIMNHRGDQKLRAKKLSRYVNTNKNFTDNTK